VLGWLSLRHYLLRWSIALLTARIDQKTEKAARTKLLAWRLEGADERAAQGDSRPPLPRRWEGARGWICLTPAYGVICYVITVAGITFRIPVIGNAKVIIEAGGATTRRGRIRASATHRVLANDAGWLEWPPPLPLQGCHGDAQVLLQLELRQTALSAVQRFS
jgi:hypothetical protein